MSFSSANILIDIFLGTFILFLDFPILILTQFG